MGRRNGRKNLKNHAADEKNLQSTSSANENRGTNLPNSRSTSTSACTRANQMDKLAKKMAVDQARSIVEALSSGSIGEAIGAGAIIESHAANRLLRAIGPMGLPEMQHKCACKPCQDLKAVGRKRVNIQHLEMLPVAPSEYVYWITDDDILKPKEEIDAEIVMESYFPVKDSKQAASAKNTESDNPRPCASQVMNIFGDDLGEGTLKEILEAAFVHLGNSEPSDQYQVYKAEYPDGRSYFILQDFTKHCSNDCQSTKKDKSSQTKSSAKKGEKSGPSQKDNQAKVAESRDKSNKKSPGGVKITEMTGEDFQAVAAKCGMNLDMLMKELSQLNKNAECIKDGTRRHRPGEDWVAQTNLPDIVNKFGTVKEVSCHTTQDGYVIQRVVRQVSTEQSASEHRENSKKAGRGRDDEKSGKKDHMKGTEPDFADAIEQCRRSRKDMFGPGMNRREQWRNVLCLYTTFVNFLKHRCGEIDKRREKSTPPDVKDRRSLSVDTHWVYRLLEGKSGRMKPNIKNKTFVSQTKDVKIGLEKYKNLPISKVKMISGKQNEWSTCVHKTYAGNKVYPRLRPSKSMGALCVEKGRNANSSRKTKPMGVVKPLKNRVHNKFQLMNDILSWALDLMEQRAAIFDSRQRQLELRVRLIMMMKASSKTKKMMPVESVESSDESNESDEPLPSESTLIYPDGMIRHTATEEKQVKAPAPDNAKPIMLPGKKPDAKSIDETADTQLPSVASPKTIHKPPFPIAPNEDRRKSSIDSIDKGVTKDFALKFFTPNPSLKKKPSSKKLSSFKNVSKGLNRVIAESMDITRCVASKCDAAKKELKNYQNLISDTKSLINKLPSNIVFKSTAAENSTRNNSNARNDGEDGSCSSNIPPYISDAFTSLLRRHGEVQMNGEWLDTPDDIQNCILPPEFAECIDKEDMELLERQGSSVTSDALDPSLYGSYYVNSVTVSDRESSVDVCVKIKPKLQKLLCVMEGSVLDVSKATSTKTSVDDLAEKKQGRNAKREITKKYHDSIFYRNAVLIKKPKNKSLVYKSLRLGFILTNISPFLRIGHKFGQYWYQQGPVFIPDRINALLEQRYSLSLYVACFPPFMSCLPLLEKLPISREIVERLTTSMMDDWSFQVNQTALALNGKKPFKYRVNRRNVVRVEESQVGTGGQDDQVDLSHTRRMRIRKAKVDTRTTSTMTSIVLGVRDGCGMEDRSGRQENNRGCNGSSNEFGENRSGRKRDRNELELEDNDSISMESQNIYQEKNKGTQENTNMNSNRKVLKQRAKATSAVIQPPGNTAISWANSLNFYSESNFKFYLSLVMSTVREIQILMAINKDKLLTAAIWPCLKSPSRYQDFKSLITFAQFHALNFMDRRNVIKEFMPDLSYIMTSLFNFDLTVTDDVQMMPVCVAHDYSTSPGDLTKNLLRTEERFLLALGLARIAQDNLDLNDPDSVMSCRAAMSRVNSYLLGNFMFFINPLPYKHGVYTAASRCLYPTKDEDVRDYNQAGLDRVFIPKSQPRPNILSEKEKKATFRAKNRNGTKPAVNELVLPGLEDVYDKYPEKTIDDLIIACGHEPIKNRLSKRMRSSSLSFVVDSEYAAHVMGASFLDSRVSTDPDKKFWKSCLQETASKPFPLTWQDDLETYSYICTKNIDSYKYKDYGPDRRLVYSGEWERRIERKTQLKERPWYISRVLRQTGQKQAENKKKPPTSYVFTPPIGNSPELEPRQNIIHELNKRVGAVTGNDPVITYANLPPPPPPQQRGAPAQLSPQAKLKKKMDTMKDKRKCKTTNYASAAPSKPEKEEAIDQLSKSAYNFDQARKKNQRQDSEPELAKENEEWLRNIARQIVSNKKGGSRSEAPSHVGKTRDELTAEREKRRLEKEREEEELAKQERKEKKKQERLRRPRWPEKPNTEPAAPPVEAAQQSSEQAADEGITPTTSTSNKAFEVAKAGFCDEYSVRGTAAASAKKKVHRKALSEVEERRMAKQEKKKQRHLNRILPSVTELGVPHWQDEGEPAPEPEPPAAPADEDEPQDDGRKKKKKLPARVEKRMQKKR